MCEQLTRQQLHTHTRSLSCIVVVVVATAAAAAAAAAAVIAADGRHSVERMRESEEGDRDPNLEY